MILKKLRSNKVWRFLCSIKLALILLAFIAIASIIGTLIPQDLSGEEHLQKYGKTLYNLFAVFNFFDIYHSFWFILLLCLLGINLSICSVESLKITRSTPGLFITHFSLVIILLGALISTLLSQKGFMGLSEGEVKDIFFIGDKQQKLNFKLFLERFVIQWHEPESHQLVVYFEDENRRQTYSVRLQEECRVRGTDYSFVALRYLCDFFIDQNGICKNKSERPDNPALLIQINHPSHSEKRWIFAKFHFSPSGKDNNIQFIYNFKEMIKDFQSHIKLIDQGKTVLSRVIRVNQPLKYKGYTFYQSSYDPDELNWTGLQVVNDPGVGWVFTGFIFLNIGLVITYCMKLKFKQKGG